MASGEAFHCEEWDQVLLLAEELLAAGSSFDRTRYRLLMESEAGAGCPAMRSPESLYCHRSHAEILQLLLKCEVEPLGHRVAIAVALRNFFENDPIAESGVHAVTRSSTGVFQAPASQNADDGHHENSQWYKAECKSRLISAVDDVHVQLLRDGLCGKRVHIGRMDGIDRQYSGTFDMNESIVAPAVSNEQFVWIDVIGNNWPALPSHKAQMSASTLQPGRMEYGSRLARLREQYQSPTQDQSDASFERALLLPRRPAPSSVRSQMMVQQDTVASILQSLEREYSIELPLAAIARRVQDRSCDQTTTFDFRASPLATDMSSASKISDALRQRIEEGLTMSYLNASMFAKDELHVLREQAFQGRSESAKMRMMEEEARVLEEMSHQHLLVLHTATSPISFEQQSKLLPPAGSEQRSDVLKTHHQQLGLILSAFLSQHEAVHGPLQGGAAAFSEQWVLYVDTKERIVITVRPTDNIVVGRLHTHFNACYRHLQFDEFVGYLVQASFVRFRSHVDYMYTVMDEVQRFLAPTVINSILVGGRRSSAASAEARRQRNRKRLLNVRSVDPQAGLLRNAVQAAADVAVRTCRSIWRKIRRRKTRPRDITFAALRLLNLVNREAAVFHRSLTHAEHTANTTRTMLGGCRDTARREPDNDAVLPPVVMHRELAARAAVADRSTTGSMLNVKGQGLRAHDHQHERVPLMWSMLHQTNIRAPRDHICGLEETLQDSQRLAEETSERCTQLRHLSGELMSLAMALDAETYDENLAFLGFVTAIFAPMSYWCTHMGVNFNNPAPAQFHYEHGYVVTWVCFIVFSWGMTSWLMKTYRNVDINEWMGDVYRSVQRRWRQRKDAASV